LNISFPFETGRFLGGIPFLPSWSEQSIAKDLSPCARSGFFFTIATFRMTFAKLGCTRFLSEKSDWLMDGQSNLHGSIRGKPSAETWASLPDREK